VRWLWAFALLAAFGPAAARAAEPLHVEVNAPRDAHCLDSEGLAQLVEERLGASESARGRVAVRVEIARVQGGFEATVHDRPGTARARTIESGGPDCHALDEALVMVVATAIGFAPEVEASKPVAPDPPPPPAPAPVPAAPREPLPAPAEHPRRLWWSVTRAPAAPLRVRWAAQIAAESGLLPRWASGPSLLASWLRGGTGALLETRVLIAPAEPLGGQAAAHGAAALLGPGYCVGLSHTERFTLSLCASGQLGAITLRTSGLARSARVWAELVQAELGLRAQLAPRGGRFGISAAAAALLPVWAPAFSVRDERGASQRYHSVGPGLLVEVGFGFGGSS
jgi:hypothetical protein